MSVSCWLLQTNEGRYEKLPPHYQTAITHLVRNNQSTGYLPGKRIKLTNITNNSADLTHLYQTDPQQKLLCSNWCFKYWPNGDWKPFAYQDDAALERAWKALENDPKLQLTHYSTVDGSHEIRLQRSPDGGVTVAMIELGAGWNPLGRRSWYACRGWAGDCATALEEHLIQYDMLPPKHLVLCVHGIGEALWSQNAIRTIDSIRDSVRRLRSLAASIANNKSSDPCRVEFLSIEWHHCLRGEGDETQAALEAVTQPSIPFLRRIASDVIMDVLFYQFENHRKRMQSAAAGRIHEIVRLWMEVNPDFQREGGQIVLLGHSLGSLICFDLLSRPLDCTASQHDPPHHDAADLSVNISACVALGSPVGCFLALRGVRPGPSFKLPRCSRYFNVYHRNDVVAYRLEPLLRHDLPPLPPAYVPFARGRDGQRLHVRLKQSIRNVQRATSAVNTWVAARISAAAETFDRGMGKCTSRENDASVATSQSTQEATSTSEQAAMFDMALNGGQRVDWIIQESELEAANEYISAAQAHTSYWQNEDIVAFLLNNVLVDSPPAG